MSMAANTPVSGIIEKESDCWDAKEVAKFFQVCQATVKLWVQAGLLKPEKRRHSKDLMVFKISLVKAFTPPSQVKK